VGKESEEVVRAKRFIWLIDKRGGGANEIDIFNLIDIYLTLFGDNYKKVFKTPNDEFKWLFNEIKVAIDNLDKIPLPRLDGEKICYECNRMLPYSEYTKNRRTKDGLKVKCRECTNRYQQEYWRNNPDKYQTNKSNHNKMRRKKYDL